jgi:hypothetical protein
LELEFWPEDGACNGLDACVRSRLL